ncbi:MFS transporter [Aeromicrobium terrae]|uniref:MFS transporter n=1 Tax=Aeromicrobium terrae TaxID=2498846 RepID=A0A5C8NK85_9ACTN|nr:MFS transporter [Aeromicrobium terrae]TXL61231.1 MFS transporter [Aeromicrobium terrae]
MSLRTRFWLLTALRWLPTGLVVPVVALLPLQRGLTIAEMGAAAAMQGVVVLLLELPTGGLADSIGRKPVLLASAVFAVAAYSTAALAQVPLAFALAASLSGVFRALDSGPLNAWYVDAVHDTAAPEERRALVAAGLSGSASIVGLALGGGAAVSGALVAWGPFGRHAALTFPYVVAVALAVVQIVAVVLLMHEHQPAVRPTLQGSLRGTPRAIREGIGLLVSSRVLRALVAVELFWGFGMVAFENMTPVRLAELVDGRAAAASLMGPVVAVGWCASALGAAAVPWLLRRWSPVAASVTLRVVQGGTVVAMGLAWGAVGLVAGYVANYVVHSAAGAIYETLLHEQVTNEHRATVLSLASMAMHPAASFGSVVLGLIATGVSPSAALMVGGVVLALAAPLFLVRPKAVRPVDAGRDAVRR